MLKVSKTEHPCFEYTILFFSLAVRIQIQCSRHLSIVPPASHWSKKQSVDILLAYRRDARRAANGVWHFGTQSGSCGAGTAGLGNLRSAWGSRQCCKADTRSLLLGSPGHRWRVWGKKNG